MRMRTGTIVSGIGHLALILWLLFGGLLAERNDAPPIQVSDVSLVSSAQLAQMSAAASAPPSSKPQTQVSLPKAAPKVEPAPSPSTK